MIISQGKDATLEPAYFSKLLKQNSGSSSELESRVAAVEQQQEEATKKINELVKGYNQLEKDNIEQERVLDDIATELNKLFAQNTTQDESIAELTEKVNEMPQYSMEPIPDEVINELAFSEQEAI